MLNKLRERIALKKQSKAEKQEVKNKNQEVLDYQEKFIKSNDEYDFFGHIHDERDIPVFVTKLESEDGVSSGSFVYAVTPRILEHCVEHLTHEEKIKHANNMDYFEKLCNQIAKLALYQEESWEESIDAIIVYMAQFRTNNYTR